MKQIYVFSGLGVDERVFKYIDFTGFDTIYIKWIKPDVNETIEDYAKRLTPLISAENPVLIGLSFGGMVAVEVAKHVHAEKIILLSSAKTCKEIPFYYRWIGYLKLHKILPVKLLKHPAFINDWFFGIKQKEDKKLFAEILYDLDVDFLKWAIDKILSWKNQTRHSNIIHIHGDNDRILPICFANPDFIIKGGGHFMIVNKANEIREILQSNLSK